MGSFKEGKTLVVVVVVEIRSRTEASSHHARGESGPEFSHVIEQ